MGEEAKNPKKDIPWAILLSLAIQGGICYLIEYFAANYFLNTGYPLTTAAGATAPIGDMMKLTGAWLFGSAAAGVIFMRVEAADRVPGPDRHHSGLPQHRRPRDLRHGPRRRSAVALRHVAR